ncbi:MAG: hypothetical protein KOO60_08910 [Gemmatimonadales bacterium]|nr:hypothetical protein [Gemmatimonadales bacterium]
MNSPAFFNNAPTIEMIDPLAELLGAATEGRITYTYADAVKLAGHSCPTVAGAFLMTRQALAHLYGEETPVRGNIGVDLRDAVDDGVTGVIGNVIGLITGAAGSGGFKGIGGRFNRAGLLKYRSRQVREVQFTRRDTGQTIGADYDASAVAPDEKQGALMQAIMSGTASTEEIAQFGEVWQKRVARIMTSAELWPVMVQLG